MEAVWFYRVFDAAFASKLAPTRDLRRSEDLCGSGLARDGSGAVWDQVRIPRPLTSNRAQAIYNTTVATSMNVIAMPMRISDTPRMP